MYAYEAGFSDLSAWPIEVHPIVICLEFSCFFLFLGSEWWSKPTVCEAVCGRILPILDICYIVINLFRCEKNLSLLILICNQFLRRARTVSTFSGTRSSSSVLFWMFWFWAVRFFVGFFEPKVGRLALPKIFSVLLFIFLVSGILFVLIVRTLYRYYSSCAVW